jgi:hypothetical protein
MSWAKCAIRARHGAELVHRGLHSNRMSRGVKAGARIGGIPVEGGEVTVEGAISALRGGVRGVDVGEIDAGCVEIPLSAEHRAVEICGSLGVLDAMRDTRHWVFGYGVARLDVRLGGLPGMRSRADCD